MFFSGIADEAGKAIDTQIKAHKELGWSHIELRNVDGGAITDIDDAEFDAVCGKLDDAGISVSCMAAGIANWSTNITDPFDRDMDMLKRGIPRMKRLNIPFIRAMSWPNDNLADDAWRDEAVRRMKELAKVAEDAGVTIVIENCDGWASDKPENYSRFFELVDSPAVKTVYDTGNPASHGTELTWEFYQNAKPHIVYVHIKAHTGPKPAEGELRHTWPDDPASASLVSETIKDLLDSGYDGGFSIEPHLKAVIHEGKDISDEEAAYLTYVEYGKRLMKIVEEAKA